MSRTVILAVMVLIGALVARAMAQTAPAETVARGTIVQVDPKLIILKVKGNKEAVGRVDDKTIVLIDDKPAAYADLKPAMPAAMALINGRATRIEAKSVRD